MLKLHAKGRTSDFIWKLISPLIMLDLTPFMSSHNTRISRGKMTFRSKPGEKFNLFLCTGTSTWFLTLYSSVISVRKIKRLMCYLVNVPILSHCSRWFCIVLHPECHRPSQCFHCFHLQPDERNRCKIKTLADSAGFIRFLLLWFSWLWFPSRKCAKGVIMGKCIIDASGIHNLKSTATIAFEITPNFRIFRSTFEIILNNLIAFIYCEKNFVLFWLVILWLNRLKFERNV